MKMGFISTIFIVFLILKLTKIISWSWWWVTSPIWAFILISTIVIICLLAFKVSKNQNIL